MSSFYSFMSAQKPTTSVAMDENNEKMVTIRRIFKIDPKVQKELGHEDKVDGKEEEKKETKAEDSAIFISGFAMDLSPRHTKTNIEDCKAKDKRYCPYHGAEHMTNLLDEEFKKAGIYASGAVERLKQGRYKVQYSVPESKKEEATSIINKFLSSPGFEEVSDTDSDEVDAIAKEVKMDRGNDEFAMREEHLETLENDMKKGMEIDPSELYQLRKDHHELKKLGRAAYEAAEADGIDASSHSKEAKEWKATNEKWLAYKEAGNKFEKDYNYIRGNADLAHIKTPEDCTELMGHLEKQITQVGDFVKATDEIDALKEKKGLKGKRGIAGTTDFNNAKGKIRFAIEGLKAARKQVEEANASGDVKKMRAAAHSLELVLNQVKEGKDDIAEALKQAESYKKVLESYPDPEAKEDATASKSEEKKSDSSSEKKEDAKSEKKDDTAESKKDEFTIKCEDYLFTDDGDRSVLYGEAGLSADYEHDKYREMMDDAIDKWKGVVLGRFRDDWDDDFKKVISQNLRKELVDIADEQNKNARDAEEAKKEEKKDRPKEIVEKEHAVTEALKKARAEREASEARAKAKTEEHKEAAKAYIEKLGKGKTSSSTSIKGVDKERFEKRFGAEKFKEIEAIANMAKSEGKTLTGTSGWDDYEDADEGRFESIKNLVRKLGGTIVAGSEKGGEDENRKTFGFTISPDKAHELYGKLNARGGIEPIYYIN